MDVVCADDVGSRDRRLPSSDDIRAMVDAAFSSDVAVARREVPTSSSPKSKMDTTVVESDPSPQGDLSGLGGLGESEAVDNASSGPPADVNDDATGTLDMATPRRRAVDRADSEGKATGDSESTPRVRNSELTESVAVPCPKWSEALRSPKKVSFSPSKDMNKSGSLHGLGLIAAVDRAKKLSRCGKRCANLLADVAVLYDAFAQSILKSCKTLGAANEGAGTVFAPPVSTVVTELRGSLISFSKQTQGLSICIKGSVARPLHGSASAMADTVPNIFNRYSLTRAKCLSSRQNAIRMRLKYVKALREAEEAIRDLQKARANEDSSESVASGLSTPVRQSGDASVLTPESNPSPTAVDMRLPSSPVTSNGGPAGPSSLSKKVHAKAGWDDVKKRFAKHGLAQKSDIGTTGKVIKALDDVQLFEANYIALVEEENQAVSRSQTMEAMALEALQKLEEERLQFFIETMNRALQAEKGALDNMMLNLRRRSEESVTSTLSTASSTASHPLPQNPSALFIKRKTSTPQNEDGSSVNEALALSMSEDIGRWRDTQRRNLMAEATRLNAVKVFSTFFEEVSSAALSFSNGLISRLANDGYAEKEKPKTSEAISLALNDFSTKTKPAETLATALNDCEGEKALSCLNQVVKSLVECSTSASQLGTKLQIDGRKLLEKFLLSEKEYRIALEGEEVRWKTCCDAAKELTKLRSRLEQSRSDLMKAQQRLTSAKEDSQGNRKDSTMLKKNPTMTKALGNMFSMLPEEAMTKMLAPDQRLVIVKRNVKEATVKEAKDAQAYEAAQTAKEKAITSYTAAARSASAQCSAKSEALWSSVTVGIDVMISFFQHFRESRYDSIEPATTWLQDNGRSVVQDMTQWTEGVQGIITMHSQKDGEAQRTPGRTRRRHGNIGAEDGFCLQVQVGDSKNVYKLIDLVTNEADGAALGDDSMSSGLSTVEETVTPDQDTAVVADNSPTVGELPPSEHDDGKATPSTLPKTKSASTSADLRKPSANTRELMNIAATLKDSSEQPTKVEKVTESDAIKTVKPDLAAAASKSADTELFLAHFWDGSENDGDSSSPPTVIDSFSCAYWPREGEGYMSPLLHGRLFVTSSAMYFIGWGDKKIVLKWEDVTAVSKATNMMGALDNSLRLTFDSGEGESSYFFGSFAFREDAFQIMSRLSTVARSLREIKGDKSASKKDAPPDQILKKMEVVLKKKIRNVSIKRFYENCWSEGNGTDAAPFYGPFLIEKKSHDVKVGDWEFADGKEGFENKWSEEKFPQKRVVTFKFTRTTHLYVGPPIAGVTQTQYCSVEGDDKCILEMTVEMDGIPYADVFAVEVRWVARRVGNKDLLVEVGVFVDFKKTNMFASKIRSGTIQETKPIHYALFDAVKAVCAAGPEEAEESEEEELEEEAEEGEPAEGHMFGIILSRVSPLLSAIKSFLPRLKQAGLASLEEAPAWQQTLLVVGCGLILFLGRFVMRPLYEPAVLKCEVQHLSERMDSLNNELAEVKALLKEILLVMKENK